MVNYTSAISQVKVTAGIVPVSGAMHTRQRHVLGTELTGTCILVNMVARSLLITKRWCV
jgi:hypothetical protein